MEDRITELLEKNTILEGHIVQLRNSLESSRNMLDMMINDQKPPRRKSCKDVKTLYYQEHKNDDDIQSMVSLYKKTFPTIKVPWQFTKRLTDEKYKKMEM
jgi:hypothetical protein